MMRLLRMTTILVAFLAVSAVIQLSSANSTDEAGVVVVEGRVMDKIPNGGTVHHAAFRVGFVNYWLGTPDAQVVLELLGDGGGVLASDTVVIGGDAAGGRSDVDGMVTYDLKALLGPHASGMVEMRLTVDAVGSMGADHKVLTFSVDCESDEDEGDEGGDEGQGGSDGVDLADAAGAVQGQPGFAG